MYILFSIISHNLHQNIKAFFPPRCNSRTNEFYEPRHEGKYPYPWFRYSRRKLRFFFFLSKKKKKKETVIVSHHRGHCFNARLLKRDTQDIAAIALTPSWKRVAPEVTWLIFPPLFYRVERERKYETCLIKKKKKEKFEAISGSLTTVLILYECDA